ncbi:DUF2927 domain-containing protein [Mesobacterium pallidum]|uniref:DUF2927 domain-containing protein n=1 Tax=Mesobacterium pallidum TaxID=2872037 RepID=UPI001EE3248F|nr:DUF2927 domain-containing protein [Mesobacterium pallidum]
MRPILLPLLLALGACMPAPQADQPSRAALVEPGLPPVKTFAAPHPAPPSRANGDIARDFLDLAFKLESGRDLPVLTRFEGPITLRVLGHAPRTLASDLNRLLYRLRTEAGLDIALTDRDDAAITIQAVTRADIRRQLPQAACFVAPNVSNLAQYRLARRTSVVNWTLLRERKRLAIFLPNDTSPQEMRDCLHEELAQALGPLNDLYRLPDSVFNDDNVHTVLTGFDMLILRAYYAPELRNGMTRAEVAARLPRLLARLNPAGEHREMRALGPTPRVWIDAIQTALGPGAGPAERRRAAERALQIASSMGWTDHRRAFSHYAMGRLTQAVDPGSALRDFQAADRFYASAPDTELHRAYVAAQLAAHAIGRGDGAAARQIVDRNIGAAARYENAALLATLMMLRAEALALTGEPDLSDSVRLDSLGWARYGFGADWAVRAKMREIESLNPLKG